MKLSIYSLHYPGSACFNKNVLQNKHLCCYTQLKKKASKNKNFLKRARMNNSPSPTLQVGIIATRRPDLIEIMLGSFSTKLFTNFQVTAAYLNIDPAFGSKKDETQVVDCVRSYLPMVEIRTPSTASFGAAVKWTWSQFKPGLALHLEDDWELNEAIYPKDVISKMKEGYSAVSLCGNHPKWLKRKKYLWVGVKRTKFPYFGYEKIPALGTQPKFIDGAFANKISSLMNPDLDPEKQMLPSFGLKFSEVIKYNKCGFLDKSGIRQYGVLNELGREWRAQRKIKKILKNGSSEWETAHD